MNFPPKVLSPAVALRRIKRPKIRTIWFFGGDFDNECGDEVEPKYFKYVVDGLLDVCVVRVPSAIAAGRKKEEEGACDLD